MVSSGSSSVIRLSKYVVPRPDKGIIGVAVPVGVLLGGYILLNRMGIRLPIISDAVDGFVIPIQHWAQDVKQWSEDTQQGASGIGWLFGPIGALVGSVVDFVGVALMGGIFFLSKDTGKHGDIIGMSAQGLKPSTPLKYGWKSAVNFPGYEAEYVSRDDGTWYGPAGTQGIVIDSQTPLGDYKVYLDQRPWGGGYGERNFRVIA